MVMTSDHLNDKRSNIRKELFTWWTTLASKGINMGTGQFECWEVSYQNKRLQLKHKETLIAEVEEGNVFLHVSIEDAYQLPLHHIKETVLLPD